MSGKRRPALLPCVALLAGAALGQAAGIERPLPPMALGAALALSACFPLPGRRILLSLAALALGAGLEAADAEAARRRIEGVLPVDGSAVELRLKGMLLAAPESDSTGERWLLLRCRAEDHGAGASMTVSLRVHPSSEPASLQLDALRAGDEIRAWARLKRPRAPGNGQGVDPALALRGRGLDAVGSVKSARLVERLAPGRPSLRGLADRLKRLGRARLDRALGRQGQTRALAGAMLLGDRAALGPELQRCLRETGLIHLVAISGLNVALVLWLLFGLAQRALRVRWLLLVSSVPFLTLFALVVGPRSSVLRAVLAAFAVLLGRCLGREGDALNSLAWLAAVLVASAPAIVREPGYQLTFAATAGLLLARSLTAELPLRSALARTGLALSLAAYVTTAPILAWHFGWLAPVGVLVNLVAVPLCAACLLSGYLTILTATVPWCCGLWAWCCARSLDGLIAAASCAARWEPGAFRVPQPSLGVVALYYGLLAMAFWPAAGRRPRAAGAVCFCLALLWLHMGGPPAAGSGQLEVAALDVGQGQALALRGPRGGLLLVDAGGSADPRFDIGERVVAPFLARWRARRLEAVIVTHDHVDHAGGAFAVLREFEVGELWLGPGSSHSPRLAELAALARRQGSSVVLAAAGNETDRGGIPLRVLAPGRNDTGLEGNDRSIVLLAGSEPARILMPGDLEQAGERALVDSGLPLRAEALVVAHHGSGSGSSQAFIGRVRPTWALLSVGFLNPFGHPRPEVLQRIRDSRATLLRTDLHGLIHLRAARDGWEVQALGRARSTAGAALLD